MAHLNQIRPGAGFWTVADQGVASLGNFATNIILARSLGSYQYGVFAIIFGVLYLFNSCQYSFISYPLIVKGAISGPRQVKRLTSASLILTTSASIPLGVGVMLTALILGQLKMSLWVYLALLCWEIQDTLRRALMAQRRFSEAIWGDAISYLGQAAVIWFLATRGSLSLQKVFLVVALTSLLAASIQVIQVGIEPISASDLRELSLSFAAIGKWSLFANLLFVLTMQVFPWILAFHGMNDVAGYQAATNLLAFTNPVAFSMASVIVPTIASNSNAPRSHRKILLKYASEGAALLLPFYVILAVLPESCLKLLYGAQSPYLKYSLNGPLRILVLAYMLAYLAHISASALYGQERSREVFRAQLIASGSILIGLPLTLWLGMFGAAIGFMMMNACRLVLNSLAFCRNVATAEPVYSA